MTFNFGAALAVFLTGTGTPGASGVMPTAAVVQTVPVIAPAALKAMMGSPAKFMLIDVRQPEEFAAGHIEGAMLIPLDTLEARLASLPRDTQLVVYCRAGHRSAKAVAVLLAHGFGRAVSLDGGFIAWSALGTPH